MVRDELYMTKAVLKIEDEGILEFTMLVKL